MYLKSLLQNFEKEKQPEQDTKIIFILNNVHPIGRFQHENRAFDDIIIGEMKELFHLITFHAKSVISMLVTDGDKMCW